MPQAKNHSYKLLIVVGLLVVGLIAVSAVAVSGWYRHSLSAVSSSRSTTLFSVGQGSGVHQIAEDLHRGGLIRNVSAFETYVISNNYRTKLQAGTYALNPSMSAQEIVTKMVRGDVAKNLITIPPGKRLQEIQNIFKRAGYSMTEINKAFDPATYNGHPALASLPAGASLEGYLYPDSFQKQSDTPATAIISQSLDEMNRYLSSDTISGFRNHGLSIFQAVTLASIVGQESGDASKQPIVAQVFLSRLARDMALQSDVTANYGADALGIARSVNVNSPYNTYMHKGLPPGPISNITDSSLQAVAYPAHSDYLYFVAGDDGKLYFSHTAQEHQDLINRYCKQGCAQ